MAKQRKDHTTTTTDTPVEPVEQPQEAPENPTWDPNGDLSELSDDQAQPFVDDLLNQAVTLEEERQTHMAKTAANRDTLRTVRKTGLLSEKQAAAIDLWYPPRVRKATEEGTDDVAAAAA